MDVFVKYYFEINVNIYFMSFEAKFALAISR